MTFQQLVKGRTFLYNGSQFVKKTTRTAYLEAIPTRIFYFSGHDTISTNIPESAHERVNRELAAYVTK